MCPYADIKDNVQNMRRVRAIKKETENDYYVAHEMQRGQWTKEGYADFLKSYNWDYFMTVTFEKPRLDPYYAMKTVYNTLEKNNVARAFMGCERFKTGGDELHIHGLVSGPPVGWKPEINMPWEIWEDLFEKHGRSKIEAANSQEAVSGYCSKYILKDQSKVMDYYDFFGSKLSWEK